ncbi:protein scabrous [Toxorhynchites rutilus septentrionalis]|uniref:protein scabrous n=1 Tax=Toxorhynchites rutilus septentrionalis TaxID=329112 RepID=UPI002479E6FC|nr:protein scabrous [Toxorhynchites rutilus septentrionalis]
MKNMNNMVNLLAKLMFILECISLSVMGVTGGPTTTAPSNNINQAANVNLPRFDEESIGSIQDVAVEADLFDGDSMIPVLSLEDQVRLLTKQLNTLTNQRREDYKMLENNLKKFVRKNSIQLTNAEIRDELDHLREDIKVLREGSSPNKERLTVQWLSQSISEIRSELAELQESSSNVSKDAQLRNQLTEDINTLRADISTMKLELESLKSRQEKTEVLVRELREEAVQSAEDIRRSLNRQREKTTNAQLLPQTIDFVEPEADHRMRHHRFLRQQLHELEVKQTAMKRQLSEIFNHRMADRLRSLEIEQRRLANANFNISRQVASLDKLHGSMLELLEDVEGIQNKYEKTLPDIKGEISKVEFNAAQISSEQGLLREEGHNIAKSIQAMAVSVSTLQEERDNVRKLEGQIQVMKSDLDKIKSAALLHKERAHNRLEKLESESRADFNASSKLTELQLTTKLVQQLENVENEYETIINKLPRDCTQIQKLKSQGIITGQGGEGNLYLIAPAGQHHPLMTQCFNEWTTIQRRQDGSVDFNRSWEDYANGFGSPAGEFWIGNQALHHLTNDNCSMLRIVMQDIYDNTWFADYDAFRIGSREAGFRLELAGYNGNASDAFEYQNHMQFSAIDVDRDISNTHCAGNYEGGWWFSHCQHANLNGRYNLGLTWFDASRNEWIAVKSSHMMIARRSDCSFGGSAAGATSGESPVIAEPFSSAPTTTIFKYETTLLTTLSSGSGGGTDV